MTTPIHAAIHALRPWCSDLVRARAIIEQAIADSLEEVRARHYRRVTELLEANNALLERARRAEGWNKKDEEA